MANTNELFFASVADMVRYVEALPRTGSDAFSPGGVLGVDAGGTVEDAIRLAKFGWPEGAVEAGKVAQRIAEKVVEHDRTQLANEPTINFDVMGGAFDAGAVAMGIPECWGFTDHPPVKRAVRIALNVEASGAISANVIKARGFAVAALALVLQTRGYPVTVDVVFEAGRGHRVGVVRVADAGTGSQLDLDRIVFGIAHPSILRHYSRMIYNRLYDNSCGAWGGCYPLKDARPNGDVDVFLSGVGLWETSKWISGGEDWVLNEYVKQASRENENV